MTEPVTVAQIIAAGWPAAESHDAAERPERARAILALCATSVTAERETRLTEALEYTRIIEEMAAENSDLRSDVEALRTTVAEDVTVLRAQLADAERVTGLARKLASEVTGIIGLAEMELRRAVGNSNVNALAHRLDAFQAALTPAKEQRDA